jgi:hypothetical protein
VVERHEYGHSLPRIQQCHDLSWATTSAGCISATPTASHQAERVAPRVLGIDEHSFARKDGYATTFANLGTHRVFDTELGRSELAGGAVSRGAFGQTLTQVVLSGRPRLSLGPCVGAFVRPLSQAWVLKGRAIPRTPDQTLWRGVPSAFGRRRALSDWSSLWLSILSIETLRLTAITKFI